MIGKQERKKILSLLIAFAMVFSFAMPASVYAQNGDATINPETAVYDLDAPADVTTTITWNNATEVIEVKDGEALTEGAEADYEVDDNILIIKESYLAGELTKDGEQVVLTIIFDEGENATFTITATEEVYLGVDSTDPVDKATEVAVDTTIEVTFDEAIAEGDGFEDITLMDNGTQVGFSTEIEDTVLTINPDEDLDNDTEFTVTIPANAVEDDDTGELELEEEYSFSFTVEQVVTGDGTIFLQPVGNNGSTIDTNPEFTWAGDGTGTVSYTLYVGTAPNPFDSGTAHEVGEDQSLALPDALTPGTTYYWGVEMSDDVDTLLSTVQPLTILQQDRGGRIIFDGINNANNIRQSDFGVYDTYTADLNGDGAPDVLTASRGANTISWYNNDGDGNFSEEKIISSEMELPTAVSAADLNGNGHLDVLSASSGDDKIAWYENDGTGKFGEPQVICTSGLGPQDVHAADLNGSGHLDLIVPSFYDDTIAWYENDGAGNFSSRKVISTDLAGPKAVNTADINGDGHQDVIAAAKISGEVAWFESDGAGNFGTAQVVGTVAKNIAYYVEAADLNGNGAPDLLFGNYWAENTDGEGTFDDPQEFPRGYFAVFASLTTAADLNGNGHLDVIGATTYNNQIYWHENKGDGTFGDRQLIADYGMVGSQTSVLTADIDSDGVLDVVAAPRLARRVDWYENRHGPFPFVVDGIPDQVANENVAYSYTIGDNAFDHLDEGEPLDYTATQADGSLLPGWLEFDDDAAAFSGTPSAEEAAELTLQVTATDTNGAAASTTFTLTVTAADGAEDTEVTNTGDSGPGSLRQVVEDASVGDTITFAEAISGNTITLTSGTSSEGSPGILIDKSLTIDGDLDDDGTPDITISGNDNFGIFNIDDVDESSYSDVVLKGLVLTNGRVGDRYGEFFGTVTTAENLEMRYCVIKNSSAPIAGSAVWAKDGETVLHGSEIIDNYLRNEERANPGGALLLQGIEAHVVDSTVSGNTGYFAYSAGIFATCELTVQNTAIRNNHSMFGGRRYLDPSLDGGNAAGINFLAPADNLTIEGSTITGNLNIAGGVGGVRVEADTVTIADTRIAENYGVTGGGGIHVTETTELILQNSTISGNMTTSTRTIKWNGGDSDNGASGICLDKVENVLIDSCTIKNNKVHEHTGIEEYMSDKKYWAPLHTSAKGVGIGGTADKFTLRNSTVSGNTGFAGLGAVHRSDTNDYMVHPLGDADPDKEVPTLAGVNVNSEDANIQNSTIARNAGGGLIIKEGTFTIESSIFSGNIQSEVGGATPVDIINTGGTLNVSNSLVETTGGDHGVTDGVDGNIVEQDPLLGPLSDNGGSTHTHALGGGSPAIDAGSNPADMDWDQRGPGYYRHRYDGSDMGAFEIQAKPVLPEIEDQQALVNEAFSFTVPEGYLDDPEADEPLTYGLTCADESELPGWLSFDPETRILSGTLSGEDGGSVALKASVTNERGVAATQSFELTITELDDSGEDDSSSGSGSSETPSDTVEEITVNVEEGESDTIVSTASLERTTESDGTKRDKVTFDVANATEAVNKVLQANEDTARIVIPDPNDQVSEVRVIIPKEAVEAVSQGKINLEIVSEHAKISIPSESLQELDQDLYFRVVPIKEEEKRNEVASRLRTEEVVRQIIKDDNVSLVGRPATIETNMKSRAVEITLPLGEITLPDNEQERQEYLRNLGVYIEHSDGEKVVYRGEVTSYKEDVPGLKFMIDRFSTFAVIQGEGLEDYFDSQQVLTPDEDGFHQAYIIGYPDDTFKPENHLTRAEMATILAGVHEASQKAADDTTGYSDLAPDHWAKTAIAKATQGGLLKGYPDGNFQAENAITRAEVAAITSRWLGLSSNGSHQLSDISGHWAEQVIEQAYQADILTGYPDGTFRPAQAITRAETVVVINKILDRGPLHGVKTPTWSDVSADHWAYGHIEEASRDHYFILEEEQEIMIDEEQ